MAAVVPLRNLLRICDPRRSWPWNCQPPDPARLGELLAHAEEECTPVPSDAPAERHLGRVRHLARHGWNDPIEVDVGVPCLGYQGPKWPVTDGNHRLWAACLREDEVIFVDVAGQCDHAAQLLGVPEAEITGEQREREICGRSSGC